MFTEIDFKGPNFLRPFTETIIEQRRYFLPNKKSGNVNNQAKVEENGGGINQNSTSDQLAT